MSKFLFIPRPLHEESPTSLLKRMAIKHGCVSYSDIQILFGRSDLSSSLICRTHPIIQSIAKRAGAAGQVFLSGFYEPIGPLRDVPPLQIAGLTVHPDMIRKKGTGFCSECWKGGHEYFMKDLKFSSYCPYHFRKYLTNCPHCNLTLRWHTPIGEICRCKNLLISPSCSSEEAEIEQKLLSIFRAGDAETFRHLIVCLNKLDYRIESDDQCPANRCRMSIAFALLESDMGSLMYLLRQMSSLYPKTPKRIIAAILSLFHGEDVKHCAHTFIKLSPDTPDSEIKYFSTTPIHDFSLTRPQFSAWLKISAHYWKILNRLSNIRPEKARYNWKQAQNISKEVLATKLKNGFRKKKTVITGISTKELQEKLNLSPATIKRAIDEHILTPSRFKYRIIFDESDVEAFSKKYISLQLLSSQILIPIKLIRKTINRLKIAPLNFKSRTLRSQVISVETSQLITYWYHTNGQSSAKPPQCLSPISAHHDANHTEKWLSTATAAAYLGICASIVRYLIRSGILVNARRSGAGGGYCIEKKVVDEFISRYISATEARKLLGCKRAMTTKILHSIGIEPITGPGIDGNPSSYYPRKTVVLYVTTRERSRQKNRTGYTKLEACKILKIKNSALFRLVQKGFINLVGPGLESQGLIKQCDVDNFYKKYANSSTIAPWLKTTKFTVDRILSQLGITPVSGPSIDASPRYFYAVNDILKYFRIPDLQKYENSNPELEPLLMNTSILKEKYGVSALAFGRLFISSGFTSPVRIGHKSYLLRADVKRVESILDNYYTISQAHKYLGGKQNIDNLLKTKKLTAFYPLIDYIHSPMIKRHQLQDYAIQYCYV